MSSEELPEAWARTRVGEILEPGGLFDGPFGSSLKTSDYTESGIRVIRLENLANLRFVADKETYISPGKYATLTKHTVLPGDVMVGSFVDGAVRVCILPLLPTKAIAKADCFTVRTRHDIADRRFVAMQLGASATRDKFVGDIHGATRPRITTKQLRDCELVLAPIPEQRRIVARVEALLEQVNRAKARLDRVQVILKRFRQAVLAAACSGELTNAGAIPNEIPSTWRWTTLNELLSPGGLFDGPFGSSLKTADYTDRGVRVVRLENLAQLRFIAEKQTFVSQEKFASLARHEVREGDIIFGSFVDETVRVCVLPAMPHKAIAKADCFCIRPRLDLVSREYLAIQLACQRTRLALIGEIHGATRPRINTKQLRSVELPLCSLDEQAQIVRQVARLFALADTVERRAQAAAARADKLPQAILSKAFSGELVPTEAELARAERRTYETAEELLARVRGNVAPAARISRTQAKRAHASGAPPKVRRSRG